MHFLFRFSSRTTTRLCLFTATCVILGACVPKRGDSHTTTLLYAFWGSVEQQRIERQVIEAFERENPGIRIVTLPIGARYSDKLQAMFVGNVAPDVMAVGLPNYWDWSSKGLLERLDDLLPPERVDNLMPAVRRAFEKQGHFYAVPVHAGGHVMFLNLKALREAGIDPDSLTSWDAILAAAPKLAVRGGGTGRSTQYAFMVPQALSVVWSFGGKLFDNPFAPRAVTIKSPETLEALRFLRSLYSSRYSVPYDVLGDQGGYTLFRDGKIAIYFNGRWVTPELVGIKDFEWDVRPIPKAGGGAVTHLFGSALGIWSGSRNKEAAKKFVDFYTSGRGVEILVAGGRYTPVFRDMAYGKEFLSLRPPASMKFFSYSMEAGQAEYPLFASGSLQVTEIIRSRMEQLISQPEVSEERVLEGLYEDLVHWLDRRKRSEGVPHPTKTKE